MTPRERTEGIKILPSIQFPSDVPHVKPNRSQRQGNPLRSRIEFNPLDHVAGQKRMKCGSGGARDPSDFTSLTVRSV